MSLYILNTITYNVYLYSLGRCVKAQGKENKAWRDE